MQNGFSLKQQNAGFYSIFKCLIESLHMVSSSYLDLVTQFLSFLAAQQTSEKLSSNTSKTYNYIDLKSSSEVFDEDVCIRFL